MIQPRSYQQSAEEAVFSYWASEGGNGLVDMATGTGKAVVIASLCKRLLAQYPDMRILVVVDTRELVQQDFLALKRAWPEAPAGIYSAGLGRREGHHRVTFASIQSVFRRAHVLGPRHLVIVDEAHMVPVEGEGMYLTLIQRLREETPDLRVLGLTATPYRLKSGRLDEGEGRVFDKVVFSYGIRQGIEDGWLSPLMSKAGISEIDVRGVAKQGGEFRPGALERAADKADVVEAATAEIAAYAEGRRSILIFCSGVKHAHHVRESMQLRGIQCATVTGETPAGERDRIVRDFKEGRLRAVTNAEVLTKGFDAPGVDLLAMLRPTLSTGLYIQIIGRGTRPLYPAGFDPNRATAEERRDAIASGPKPDCLVLDFAGNVRRHGPVDLVEIAPKGAGKKDDAAVKEDTVRAKECPVCHSLAPLSAGVCKDCGHEWPVEAKPKHEAHADAETPILATEEMLSRKARKLLPEEHPVVGWEAKRHSKLGAPDMLKVTYFAGLLSFDDYVCIEHGGFAGDKAARWWRRHGGAEPTPETVTEALSRMGELRRPDAVQVRKTDRWWDVVGQRFAAPTEAEEAA